MVQDIVRLSAAELLDGFRRLEFSPVELLHAQIAQSEEVDGPLRGVAETMYDLALPQARESERRWLNRHGVRPLEGVTVALKEVEPIAGRVHSEGSELYAHRVARSHGILTDRILRSGAVTHVRTTTPEFSAVPMTRSKRWGASRNPWNSTFSPGGSSGGSAIVVATYQSALATGSDIGGSIREPAAFCGVVGYKPPFGRNAAEPPLNQDPYYASGPLARTVQDAALLQNVLAGPDPRDHAALRPALRLPLDYPGVDSLRIGWTRAWGSFPLDPEIATVMERAVDELRHLGASVEEFELPFDPQQVGDVTYAHFGYSLGGMLQDALDEAHRSSVELSDYVAPFAARLLAARQLLTYPELLVAEAEIARPVTEALQRFDAVVGPTNAFVGFQADSDYADGILEGSLSGPYQYLKPAFVANILSRVPALQVPVGRSTAGIPVGATVITRSFADETAFRVGHALETRLREVGVTRGWTPGDGNDTLNVTPG